MRSLELLACTADDATFIFEVTRAAMRRHVEQTWGRWDDWDQRRRSDVSFDPTTHSVIMVNNERVGLVAVDRRDECLTLEKLYLWPRFQNRGIGSAVLRGLIAQARARSVPLRLRVLRGNPVRALYERFGFKVVRETEERVFLECTPGPS